MSGLVAKARGLRVPRRMWENEVVTKPEGVNPWGWNPSEGGRASVGRWWHAWLVAVAWKSQNGERQAPPSPFNLPSP
eukprot:scaffold211621_cov30-Tisochrysis_lutea.AAC.1